MGPKRPASEAEWGAFRLLSQEPAEHTPGAPAQSALREQQNEKATRRTGDQLCKITYLIQD